MLKKIIGLILSLIVGLSVLSGCSLFSHDFTRDMGQVIAVVKPITDGGFTSAEKKIYKSELYNQFYNNYSSLIEQYGTAEAALDNLLDQFIKRELVLVEADRLMYLYGEAVKNRNAAPAGERDNLPDPAAVGFTLTLTDENTVKKAVYDQIDADLFSLVNTILNERGEPQRTKPETSSSASTTYPTPTPEVTDTAEQTDTEPWVVDRSRYPSDSVELAAVKRYISLIERNAENDLRATAGQKAEFKREVERLKSLDLAAVYPELGGTAILGYLVGRYQTEQVKLTKLQNFITGQVNVSADEIQTYYDDKLIAQKAEFDGGAEGKTAYVTALGKDDDIVLYHPNGDNFFVRHILIPFGDDLTKKFDAYKASGNFTQDQIKAYRAQLAAEIKVYKHLNGENDLSRTYTVAEAYSTIRGVMSPFEGYAYEAERAFIDLIYDYNTDPGIFTSVKGYLVKPKLDKAAEEKEDYMQEFADAARELHEKGVLGAITEPILTDYGYHILYYANKIEGGAVMGLDDYITQARFKTFRDFITEKIKTNKENTKFTQWQDSRVSYYINKSGTVTKYKDRYKNLYAEA